MNSRINSPMIVVSNRLPFILEKDAEGGLRRKQCAGGLVTAVAPVVIECKGTWVGWPGTQLDDNQIIPESDPTDNAPTAGLLSEQVEIVQIENKLFDQYYNGCCNGTFWPLFHSMPDRAVFTQETWEAYKIVNDQFAKNTLNALRKCIAKLDAEGHSNVSPLVWIHDYQLMLAANTVRRVAEEEGLRCKMSFFLHIPFPSWDIMRLFPWDDEILEGILGCDLVGFHIDDYCLNFLDCCQRRLGCRVDRTKFILELDGRTIHVKALPIGIPYDHFAELSKTAPVFLKEKNQKYILGVDRLDYTKGLVSRVKAFEKLLEKHPEHLEKVTFLQVAVPSRTDVKEYQALKEEMDQLIGRVNGRFSKPNWSPIRYIFGCISQEQLSAFYRDSAVAIVTPLRDGMNLVAKEYVACQDLADPGVLLLSPFAGAGGMMLEALLVNPYELDDVADKMHRALMMPFDERHLRMKHLQRREKSQDVTYWLNSFLSAMGLLISDVNYNPDESTMNPLAVEDFDQYLSDFITFDKSSLDTPTNLSLILDYDGTLAHIGKKPEQAVMPPGAREILERLSKQKEISICIISGRSLENLKEIVQLEGITYAGSHGLEILSPDGTKYVHPITAEHDEKIKALLGDLEEVCKGSNGAWIENKGALLTFHYREVPVNLREGLLKKATNVFAEHGFTAHKAPMAIEAKPVVEWDQGRASLHILKHLYGEDWSDKTRVIYAGDDPSDEEAMEALSGIACSFKVSSTSTTARTSANYRLKSPDEVLLMLKWIEKRISFSAGRSPSPGSPRLSKSPLQYSYSFDESSDDEMRRLRTNSFTSGRTQKILRSSKALNRDHYINSALRKLHKSGTTSISSSSPEPELVSSPPSLTGESVINRVL